MNRKKALSYAPEPWQVEEEGEVSWISSTHPRAGVGDLVCNPPERDLRHSLRRWPANARRIVECVNACRGINPRAVPQLVALAQWLSGRLVLGGKVDSENFLKAVTWAQRALKGQSAKAGRGTS
ncbi:MAG: hypothetical protein ABFE07_28505 [Armatimonadia bacterium]